MLNVKVTKETNIELLRKACSFTISKESKMDLDRAYKCEHSPCRTQMFTVEMYDVPTFVSTHFVRHKVGCEHFVKSNREDRIGYSGDLGRWQPSNHMMFLNAQSLIQMARKRLCSQTHEETRKWMEAIKVAVATVDPDLAEHMKVECEYRNGLCPELRCCGRNGN